MPHHRIGRLCIMLLVAPFAWASCGGDDSTGSTTAGGTAGSTGQGSTSSTTGSSSSAATGGSSTSGGAAGSSSTSGGAGTGSGTTSTGTGTGGTTGSGGTSGNPAGCPAKIPQDGSACNAGSLVCDYPSPIDPNVTLHCRCENMKWLCLD